jgi:tetratricopeptide (TPR) repeat protein
MILALGISISDVVDVRAEEKAPKNEVSQVLLDDIAEARKRVEQDASSVNYSKLAQAYGFAAMWDKAFTNAQEAVRRNGKNTDALNIIGIVYRLRGELDLAEQYFKKTIRLNPEYADVYGNYCNLFSQQGKHDDAVKMARKALRLDPGRDDFVMKLGRTLRRAKRYDESSEVLQEAAKTRSDKSFFLYELGATYHWAGKLQKAINAYEQVPEGHKYHQKAQKYKATAQKVLSEKKALNTK